MRKTILFLAAVFVIGTAGAQQINDPNVEVRKVSGYNAIRVSNAIDLYLTQSDEEVVAVSADRTQYRDHIKTVVEDGVLKISYSNTGDGFKMGNRKLKAYVSVKDIIKLQASGASDVVIAGSLKGERLSIELNGASDLKGDLEFEVLDVKLNGASDATVTGRVVNFKIDANGASDLKGYELETDNCIAEASGASDIKITVNKELSAKASGASGVHYKGSGVIIDVKTSGASSISKRGN